MILVPAFPRALSSSMSLLQYRATLPPGSIEKPGNILGGLQGMECLLQPR